MAITVMYWNMQNLGARAVIYGGANPAPLWAFVSEVAHSSGVDILCIMEVRGGIINNLDGLRLALDARYGGGAAWHYDWIKAAIAPGTPPNPMGAPINGNINTFAQTAFTGRANNEGYAVLWNNARPNFNMMPATRTLSGGVDTDLAQALVPGGGVAGVPHALELVTLGRDRTGRDAHGNHTAVNFAGGPLQNDADFPVTFSTRAYRNGSRRPAFFVIELVPAAGAPPIVPADRFVPVLVYHAPAGINSSAPAGTNLAAFSRPLYRTHNLVGWMNSNRALAGGDFNVDTYEGWLDIYDWWVDPFVAAPPDGGGAGGDLWAILPGWPPAVLPPAVPAALRSTVQLRHGINGPPIAPILFDNSARYRRHAIDNIIHRGFGAATAIPPNGEVYDLISAVYAPGAGNLVGPAVAGFFPILMAAVAAAPALGPFGVPLVAAGGAHVYRSVDNWLSFAGGIAGGGFPTFRSAAEFVRLFISDHLPVTIQTTVV